MRISIWKNLREALELFQKERENPGIIICCANLKHEYYVRTS